MKEQTMFNEIFKEAREKGFESDILLTYIGEDIKNDTTIELLYYTELQKWLREEHKMYVSVVTDIITLKCGYEILVFSKNFGDTRVFENEYNSSKWDLTYEKALSKAIQEALKLI